MGSTIAEEAPRGWRVGHSIGIRRPPGQQDGVLAATDRGPCQITAAAAIAGYPGFGEFSRDLMTSYEGLFLATNRWSEGRG